MRPIESRAPASSCRRRADERAHGPHPQHPFRRHRRRRYGRHSRGAAESRLLRRRHGSQADERHGKAALARRARRRGARRGEPRRGRRRRRLERRGPRQSRGRRRARAPHPRRAPRGDARGAHALSLRHRDRRHARQDHDDQSDRQRACRGRRRSDVRDRRPASERQRQCEARSRPLSRRRGRRERCLVPAPAADDRRRHEHRRRSPRQLRERSRPLEAGLPRVPAQPAVLWIGRHVQRRRQHARADSFVGSARHELRLRRARGHPRVRHRAQRAQDALQSRVQGAAEAVDRRAQSARASTTC